MAATTADVGPAPRPPGWAGHGAQSGEGPHAGGGGTGGHGADLTAEFRAEAQRMPPVTRRLLLEGAADGGKGVGTRGRLARGDAGQNNVGALAKALVDELGLPAGDRDAAMRGLLSAEDDAILRARGALSPAACAALRAAVDAEWRSRPDTVDGAPDIQLNLCAGRLAALAGVGALQSLTRLAHAFAARQHRATAAGALDGSADGKDGGNAANSAGGEADRGARALSHPDDPADATAASAAAVTTADPEIFVRRYTARERPWNPFHVDAAAVTVNVALCDDSEFEGGRLLAVCGGAVRRVSRAEGEATVHSSALLHGVSSMHLGRRYSLVLFYGRKPAFVPPELRFTEASRRAEADALATLWLDRSARAECDAVLPEGALGASGAVLDALVQRHRACAAAAAAGGPCELGGLIEAVVQKYEAPHLRPTDVAARRRQRQSSDGAAGWHHSLRAAATYIALECQYAARGTNSHHIDRKK